MWKIEFERKAAGYLSDLKKKTPKLFDKIILALENDIGTNPFLFPSLKGKLKNFRSYHLSYQQIEYRIVYEVYRDKLVVLVIAVGSREGIYKLIKRRL